MSGHVCNVPLHTRVTPPIFLDFSNNIWPGFKSFGVVVFWQRQMQPFLTGGSRNGFLRDPLPTRFYIDCFATFFVVEKSTRTLPKKTGTRCSPKCRKTSHIGPAGAIFPKKFRAYGAKKKEF